MDTNNEKARQVARAAYEKASRSSGGHLTSLDAAIDAVLALRETRRRTLEAVCDEFEETLDANEIVRVEINDGGAIAYTKHGSSFEGENLYEAVSEVAEERADDGGVDIEEGAADAG